MDFARIEGQQQDKRPIAEQAGTPLRDTVKRAQAAPLLLPSFFTFETNPPMPHTAASEKVHPRTLPMTQLGLDSPPTVRAAYDARATKSFQFPKRHNWDRFSGDEQAYFPRICPMPTQQELFTLQMRKVCEEHGVPTTRVGEAVHVLLGSAFRPPLTLPSQAPALWHKRTGEDRNLNPIEFFNKHWGSYREGGVLFQADLQRLDKQLYSAIDRFCRYRGLEAKDYLPPPSRKQHGDMRNATSPSR